MCELPLHGRTLAWHPVPDPPGGWAYSLDDEILAEMAWSDDEGLARSHDGRGFVLFSRLERGRGYWWGSTTRRAPVWSACRTG